jgi:hypothetical protein
MFTFEKPGSSGFQPLGLMAGFRLDSIPASSRRFCLRPASPKGLKRGRQVETTPRFPALREGRNLLLGERVAPTPRRAWWESIRQRIPHSVTIEVVNCWRITLNFNITCSQKAAVVISTLSHIFLGRLFVITN